jgi:hypothetical protein
MSGISVISAFQKWSSGATEANPNANVNLNKEMFIVGLSSNVTRDDMSGPCMKSIHFLLMKPVKYEQLIAVLKAKKQSTSLKDAREILAHSAEFIDPGTDDDEDEDEDEDRDGCEDQGNGCHFTVPHGIERMKSKAKAKSKSKSRPNHAWDFSSIWAHIPSPSDLWTRRNSGQSKKVSYVQEG